MSPTSTDAGADERRFRRALAFTVATLAVLCIVFLGLGYLQGPKLASAQVDVDAVTSQSGQQLRLFANQAVAHVDEKQVSVTPAVPFSVSTTGDVIAVQFDQRLDYATNYTVSVAGVTSVYLAQPATVDYSFTTGTPDLFYLDRGEPDDAIVSTGISGAARQVIYSARHIQDFAVLATTFAVVTLADDHTSSLSLVSRAGDVTEPLLLPDTGSIRDLDAAASGSLFGFTLTSAAAGLGQLNASTLYTYDITTGRRTVEPVLGLDGRPMNVLGWQFVPGTNTIIALNIDRSLILVDPATKTVTPLGQYQELDKVSPDGSVVTVTDSNGAASYDLATGTETRLTASPLQGAQGFLGATQVLANGDRVEKVVIPDATGTRFSSLLVYDDGTSSRVLYQTPNGLGSINDFSVSPNGQYVAIETVPDAASSVSDGYYYDARATSVTTVIVALDSGAQTRSVEGFALQW